MVQDEAYEIFDETVNLADELLISGYDLDEISDEINVKKSQEILILMRSQNQSKALEFLVTINSEEIGYQSEILLNDDNAIIVKIVNVVDAYIPDFEDVVEDIELRLINLKKNEFLGDMLSTIALEIKPDGADGFYRYADTNGAQLNKIKSVKRSIPSNEINPETQRELFKIEKSNILMF